MIVQSLPASGKTFLVNKHPHRFSDIDVVVESVFDRAPSAATSAWILQSNENRKMLLSRLRLLQDRGFVILTNMYLDEVTGTPADVRFTYGRSYLQHINLTDRQDLLDDFSKSELLSWSTGSSFRPNAKVVLMKPGVFLDDLIWDYL